jgi:general secretion pathway protein J
MRPGPESARGFTLLEMVIALVLLATMLGLAWSGLGFALRGWDTGEAKGRRTVDLQLAQNFLRRELAEVFPMRWKDPVTLRLAFEGDARHMRFVSTRAAGASTGGLALVGLAVEPGADPRQRNLVMRRALSDDTANDFSLVDAAEQTVLIADVDAASFAYFGAENDFAEPRWVDEWTFKGRIPQLVRLRMKTGDGTELPEIVARVMLGEEAGCLENQLQRVCRPRAQ